MAFTVKQARMFRDKTQEQCATILGIHVQTYRKLEENPEEMTIKQASVFARFVDIAMADIIFLSSNQTESRV